MSKFENNPYGEEGSGAGVGEDLYNTGAGSGGAGDGGGLKRSVPAPEKKLGYRKPLTDPRLYRTHDRVAALSKPQVAFDASRDDRMSKDEAGRKMESIVKLYGLNGEKPEVLEAFYRAVFYCHSVNGSSVLQPGRAVLTIAGSEFDYAKLVAFLGDAHRRFFRAYADEVLSGNKRILSNDDPYNVVAQEQADNLRQVAVTRGLQRYPYLCHDSADACTGLSDAEQSALMASKSMVFSVTENMADRNRYRPGQSGDSGAGSMNVLPTARATALGGQK